MNKFEKGDKIEVNVFGCVWVKANFISDDVEGYPVFRYTDDYSDENGIQIQYDMLDSVESYEAIRPVSTICDKARRIIKLLIDPLNCDTYKVKVTSYQQYLELMQIVNSNIKYFKCFDEYYSEDEFNKKDLVELELDTGNLTYHRNQETIDYTEAIDTKAHAQFSFKDSKEIENDELKDQLKEKDTEIERLKSSFNRINNDELILSFFKMINKDSIINFCTKNKKVDIEDENFITAFKSQTTITIEI